MVYNTAKTWRSRYFNTSDSGECEYLGVTLQLLDALPGESSVRREFSAGVDGNSFTRDKIDFWLDSCLGCCAFEYIDIAECVENALLSEENNSYDLISWCVMPSHIHALIRCKEDVSKIAKKWMDQTDPSLAKICCSEKKGRELSPRWGDFGIRKIEDELQFKEYVMHIHKNPVEAGLCRRPEEWIWSSAWRGHHLDSMKPLLAKRAR